MLRRDIAFGQILFCEEFPMTDAIPRVVAGSANPGLAAAVAERLGVESNGCSLARFPGGEVRPDIDAVIETSHNAGLPRRVAALSRYES